MVSVNNTILIDLDYAEINLFFFFVKRLPQNVKKLALVFMETLDLNIEKSIGINHDSTVLLDKVCQSLLVTFLDLNPLVSVVFFFFC